MPEQAPAPIEVPESQELVENICGAMVEAGGALRFDTFMELALYHPAFGYYTRTDRQRVGRGGDFITSVSIGRCFGMLLARYLAPKLTAMAAAGEGELLVAEPGAEGGQLAGDVMGELGERLPTEVFERVKYVAVEPFEAKRDALEAALRDGGVGRFQIVSGWGELSGSRGVLIANEVLDAMPLRRLRWRRTEWRELGVGERDGALLEVELGAVEAPEGAPAELGEGFTVERCVGIADWFGEIAGAFDELHACVIDYGLERSADFFDPGRCEGTLRAYRDHQLVDDPLSAPGMTDLTAHVDFEAAANGAADAGLEVVALTDQHRFLVAAAREWLLEIEQRGTAPDAETAKLIRQFQSLSHPAAMGMAFKVLELAK